VYFSWPSPPAAAYPIKIDGQRRSLPESEDTQSNAQYFTLLERKQEHKNTRTMATPVTLRRLSGDLLVIYPTPSDSWAQLAFQALPKAERPAHSGKIRILQGTEEDPYTLWIDPPTRVLRMNDMGKVTDGQHEYIRAGVGLEEDEEMYGTAYFFYRYDPLGPVEDILYRAKDVQYEPSRWHMDDFLTIPDGVQPVPMDQFLPREWYDLLEDCQEKWRDALDDLCAQEDEDQDEMEEEFVERMMNQRHAFMERVGQ